MSNSHKIITYHPETEEYSGYHKDKKSFHFFPFNHFCVDIMGAKRRKGDGNGIPKS